MSLTNPQQFDVNSAFQLKGRLFTLTVMHLLTADITKIAHQLTQLVQQTPKFFQHMPLVLDLQKLTEDDLVIDFANIIKCLQEHHVIAIGIRGANPAQQEAAIKAGLAILPNTKAEWVESQPTPPAAEPATAKLITQPVRSGQQIYARNSDLIVLAAVSPGAELLADGNIHVYGPLRGRALAGVNGDQQACIFCQFLDAELVAIAGHYWLSEDLQNNTLKNHVQIHLEHDRLHVKALNSYNPHP